MKPEQQKTGSYAVSTNKTRLWTSTPIIQTQLKPKRAKVIPVIKNPIFAECAKLTDDSFWIAFFNQASLGKFPRSFTFSDTVLTYKRGTRSLKFEVPNDPIQAVTETMKFLIEFAGMMSDRDRQTMKETKESKTKNFIPISSCTWSHIKKDGIKDILIHNFINDVTKHFNLNNFEKCQLETTIRMGFFLGYFQGKHVILINGKIAGLHFLNFDTEKRFFFPDSNLKTKISKTTAKKSSSKKLEKKSFINQWKIFIGKTQNRPIKYNYGKGDSSADAISLIPDIY